MSVWVLRIFSEQPEGSAGESGMCGAGKRIWGTRHGCQAGRVAITVLRESMNVHLESAHMDCTGTLLLLSAQEEGTDLSGLMPGLSHENVVPLQAILSVWFPV